MARETICVYAGSFDPPTEGHMYMIRKGSQLFSKLVVALGTNPDKHYTFSPEERLAMLRACTKEFANVEIEHFVNLYLVDYAKSAGAQYILRGIRGQDDYEFEHAMRNVNEDLDPSITTVFLMPPREICEVSSSFVRGLVGPKGWEEVIKPYVPPPVYEKLLQTTVRSPKQTGGPEAASD